MLGEISLNAGGGTILSAVVLALPWQAGAAPCLMHSASPCSVTSSSGQPVQNFEGFYTLLLLVGFSLLLSPCTIQVTLLHECKTLFSVDASLSFCLQEAKPCGKVYPVLLFFFPDISRPLSAQFAVIKEPVPVYLSPSEGKFLSCTVWGFVPLFLLFPHVPR